MSKHPVHSYTPWNRLDPYRGKFFEGRWPSLPQMFNISADRRPDSPCFEAFSPEHICLTYTQAKEKILKVADYLWSIGVRKGDRVALSGKNSPQWAVAYFGIIYTGAIVAPVDYSLSDEEIEHLVDFIEIKGIFIDGDRFERIGQNGKYGFKISLEEKEHEDCYIFNLPDVGKQPYSLPVADDLCAFLFTSGTTGTPKAVMLTHGNMVSDAWLCQKWMNIYDSDVFYAILPIHHAYTMLAVFIEAVCNGTKIVFGKRFATNHIIREVKEGGVTMFLAVPLFYNKLLAGMIKTIEEKGKLASVFFRFLLVLSGFCKKVLHINIGKKLFGFVLDKISFKNVRICISGGGPLPPSTFRTLNQMGIDFVQGYGLTETSPIISLNPVFDYEEKSVGKVAAEVEVKFINTDEQGNGEICVRGPIVMQGYFNNPEATAEIFDDEGWLKTGDVGYMDNQGFLYITGRAKNIIVTEGGKNVFPEEIEDRFQTFEDIGQICVTGCILDRNKKSEGIAAIIYPSSECSGKITDAEEMQIHMEGIVDRVNENLLPYKRIRKVFVIDEPMEITSTKKIKRFTVKEKYKSLLSEG